jgi:hypothetical protein
MTVRPVSGPGLFCVLDLLHFSPRVLLIFAKVLHFRFRGKVFTGAEKMGGRKRER